MPISRALLLKGLGGVAAVAGGGLAIAKRESIANYFKSQEQVDKERKQKVEEVNGKLKTLGLGEDYCTLATTDFPNHKDSDNYSKECELDQAKFKKVKFSNAGDNDVDVQGWTGENKIKLKISNKSNGGIGFFFSGHPSNLTISKSSSEQESKITIRSGKETEFEMKDDKLSKVVDQAFKDKLDGINKKMVGAGLPTDCSFDITEKDKTLECGLDDAKLKKIKFSNKGDGDLTLKDTLEGSLKIKVEVKDKEEDATFSFTGLSKDLTLYGDKTKGKIVLRKEGVRTFKEKDGKLEKVSLNEQAITDKLRDFNEKTSQTLSLPDQCRFDEAETDTSIECSLASADLKKIKFSNKGEGELTVNEEPTGNIKLKVERKDDDIFFSFHDLSKDLTIYGDKTKGKIVLKQSSGKEFKVVDEKLEKVPQDAAKAKKLGEINKQLSDLKIQDKCRFDENDDDTSFECELSLDEFKAIKLTSKENETLTVSEGSDLSKMKLKVEYKKETDDDEETIYSISELDKKLKFGKTGEEITLETDKSYGFEVRDNKFGPMRLVGGSVGMGTVLFSNSCTYDGNSNKGTCKTPFGFMEMIFDENGSEVSESITWTDNNNAKQETFNFWEYQEGYAEGIKFTYRGEEHTHKTKTDRKLEKDKDYELKRDKDKIWRLKEKAAK